MQWYLKAALKQVAYYIAIRNNKCLGITGSVGAA